MQSKRLSTEQKKKSEAKIFASINKYNTLVIAFLDSTRLSIDQLNSNCSAKTMKRSLSTAAISVLLGGQSADAFVSRGGVMSSSCCSPKIQNQNRLIPIQSDHMSWNPAASYSSLSACDIISSKSSPTIDTSPSIDMCNDKSSACNLCNDGSSSRYFSRREMMDITLGALTGWILGPRVATSSSQDNDIEEMIRKPSEG